MQCLARTSLRLYARGYSTRAPKKINRLLCANRGEIATRVFRAATELNVTTIAIYSQEDAASAHRYKADEAYRVGKGKTPVGAYLGYEEIVQLAKHIGVDAIHPGYGFLSENADFAKLCEDNDITFIGPPSTVLQKMGDKTAARSIAIACGVPVVPGTDGPIATYKEAVEFVEKVGFPIIIKAAFGGGGRGMRVVKQLSDLEESFNRCVSEGQSFFGNGTVFIERYVERPRHIEVQLLGDTKGNLIHLYDRDCSIQRRHQKVVEIAPASVVGNLPEATRLQIFADALKIGRHVGYQNAGTAEFLVDQQGRHYFIEVNPRVQVEHTVTEEITGVDIVASQIQIAEGKSLQDIGLEQDKVQPYGCAVQCRVTSEDPLNNFQPDTGRLTTFRTGEGMGIRLDAGSGFAGSTISPHYDSLLVKVTGRSRTYEGVIRKLTRALQEFRVRGVKTNIPFILQVLNHPEFRAGNLDTSFLERYPDLFKIPTTLNRAEKLLHYFGHLKVNGLEAVHLGASGPPPTHTAARKLIPDHLRLSDRPLPPIPDGWRQVLLAEGPKGFAKKIREHKSVLLTDTTMRDAHQSLLATRVRSIDLKEIAPATARLFSPLLSLENWGGATYDVALRFLYECPWDRLDMLRELIPNIPFQMLLRGANAVGYTSYPDNVVYKFCQMAQKHGMDIFRVFDSLNYMDNLKLGIDAVGSAGGVVEASICYTGDVSDPTKGPYTLEYYLNFATELMKQNIHILNIKDMAGLLKPEAATILISALRKEFPHIPIHVHTHDTAGTGVASMLAAAKAGADVVDAALDSMSGLTSQPSLGALVGSLGNKCDLKLENLMVLNDYWEAVRGNYAPFESGQKSGSCDVYLNEIPGGQYTNLLFQATQLGLAHQWPQIKRTYSLANKLLGNIIKVTPSSKIVGDLAQFLVQNNFTTEQQVLEQAEKLSFPSSVVEYFEGKIGIPHFGFPEPLRTRVLGSRPAMVGRPGATLPDFDFVAAQAKLEKKYPTVKVKDTDVMNYAMYPKITEEYFDFGNKYGDVSVIPSQNFFDPLEDGDEVKIHLDRGKKLFVKMTALGNELNESGEREVFFELNGNPRSIRVRDLEATKKIVEHEKATGEPGSIGAPMPGGVIKISAKAGDVVRSSSLLLPSCWSP